MPSKNFQKLEEKSKLSEKLKMTIKDIAHIATVAIDKEKVRNCLKCNLNATRIIASTITKTLKSV